MNSHREERTTISFSLMLLAWLERLAKPISNSVKVKVSVFFEMSIIVKKARLKLKFFSQQVSPKSSFKLRIYVSFRKSKRKRKQTRIKQGSNKQTNSNKSKLESNMLAVQHVMCIVTNFQEQIN